MQAAPLIEPDWREGGGFHTLSHGRAFYRREGPAHGVPIVLVHGATVPSWEFDALVPPLLEAGFQTLRFDLYGHGLSDRPRGDYGFDRFARQLAEIIEASDFPRPAVLLGHSFGAALVAELAATRPNWVSGAVLVTPMLDFSSGTRWSKFFRYPGIGEIVMELFGVPALVRRRRRRYRHIGMPHLTARFIEQVGYTGYSRALLSMFRAGALGDQASRYASLCATRPELLVITGEQDAIIPALHVAKIRSLLPTHQHLALAAEHNLLLTHPEAVVRALAEWCGARPAENDPAQAT